MPPLVTTLGMTQNYCDPPDPPKFNFFAVPSSTLPEAERSASQPALDDDWTALLIQATI
jgi:hypothetical protein